MMKMTQKQIKEMILNGGAIDITRKTHEEIQQIKKEESFLNELGYSKGVYGVNGGLYQGYKTGKLYAIAGRTTTIFSI